MNSSKIYSKSVKLEYRYGFGINPELNVFHTLQTLNVKVISVVEKYDLDPQTQILFLESVKV